MRFNGGVPTAINQSCNDLLPITWTRPWYASIAAAAVAVLDAAAGSTQTEAQLGKTLRQAQRPESVIPVAELVEASRISSEVFTSCADDVLAALNSRSASLSLTNHRGLPVVFVEPSTLPEGMAYETFISATGKVPTRNNLHDFFNALVWLSFPHIKRQLNALQAAQIAHWGVGKSRGSARDAATIFDENSALLVVRDSVQGKALIEALRGHQWRNVLLDQRSAFSQHVEPWLFGHALMEKLVKPYKSITAHAWVVMAPDDFFAMAHNARREWLDLKVANELAERDLHGLSTDCFTPLPVLGIPGWWQSQDQQFYDDATVFRPKRGE